VKPPTPAPLHAEEVSPSEVDAEAQSQLSASRSIQRSVGVVVLLVLCVLCAVDASYDYHQDLALKLDPGEALRHALWRFGLRVLVLVGVAALTLRAALRPLRSLSLELNARQSSDAHLLSTQRPRELAPLVQAMNQMLSVQRDSAEQQRKFVADASHQLRTPLAVLRTQLQALEINPASAAEAVPKMLRTVERTTDLANQLLSVAKVEQLARLGDWQPVNLEAVAREVALELSPLMARKRLAFTLDALPVVLQSDAWLVGELLRNLLSNAVHHSPVAGELGIVLRYLRDEVELIVWDRGGGVEESVKQRLFEPFSASKGGTGIGLGLSICRQIAVALSAQVDLFNRVELGQVSGVDAVVRWPRSLTLVIALP
jgi:two-component system, OmpR family, sensor histidine kinase TctE